jgi:hypothetical protein
MTHSRWVIAILGVLGLTLGVQAGEMVGVPGTSVKYPATIKGPLGNQVVEMKLTGVGLRTKYFFKVYTIGSYVHKDADVHTASQLASVNVAKRLHLVFVRDVSGKDMADGMRTAIRQNYPAPAFAKEIRELRGHMEGHQGNKGDHVVITHIPGVGLHVFLVGKTQFFITNPRFSKAIWDIYLGPRNLGEDIKRGLVSRLGK